MYKRGLSHLHNASLSCWEYSQYSQGHVYSGNSQCVLCMSPGSWTKVTYSGIEPLSHSALLHRQSHDIQRT